MNATYDEAAWTDFRRAREAELTQPFGWLAIDGFAWLGTSPTAIEGLPGTWWTDGDNAYVDAGVADGLRRDGTTVEGRDQQTVEETARTPWLEFTGPDAARRGNTQIELMRRGGRLCVRWRTETSAEREQFDGVPTFPFDPEWVLPGRFTPYEKETRVDVATHKPELRQQLRAVGEVEFDAPAEGGSAPQKLTVTSIKYGLSVEFHDPTNGAETPAWRQLKIADPAPDGSVTLDFNRAIDMWFAFTDHATCPAPSTGNTITVPVRAGERSPE